MKNLVNNYSRFIKDEDVEIKYSKKQINKKKNQQQNKSKNYGK